MGVHNWPVEVYTDIHAATEGVDAVMCLRLQLERQQAGLLPDLREYSARYCLGFSHLANAQPNAKILHPGPMNRGLEIASDLADCADSLVLDQVEAGVATRMAILFLIATHRDSTGA